MRALPAYKFSFQKSSLFFYPFLLRLMRAGGIEPPFSDWQPEVLPLNYARILFR